ANVQGSTQVTGPRRSQNREPDLVYVPTQCQSLVVAGRSPMEMKDDRPFSGPPKFDRAPGSLSDFAAAEHLGEEPPSPGDKPHEAGEGERNDQPSQDKAHHRLQVAFYAERQGSVAGPAARTSNPGEWGCRPGQLHPLV